MGSRIKYREGALIRHQRGIAREAMKARWSSAGFGEPPGSVNAATHFEKSTRYRMVSDRYGVTLRQADICIRTRHLLGNCVDFRFWHRRKLFYRLTLYEAKWLLYVPPALTHGKKRQYTYNVLLRCLLVTIVDMENQ